MESVKENNGFGPLPKQRGYLSKLIALLVIIVGSPIAVWWESTHAHVTFEFYINSLILSLLAWSIGQLLYRICLLVEESRHLHSRYEDDWKKAVAAVFYIENIGLVAAIIAIIVLLSVNSLYNNKTDIDPLNTIPRLFLLNAIFIPAVFLLFGLNKPPKVELSYVNENEKKNLADGLAWSYYFGYLKFVLPALQTQINKTDQVRYNLIKVEKLFILIPKNCVISDNKDISNKDTDPRGLIKLKCPLEPLKKSRGGILDRVYKHTVHSITDDVTGEEHLCVMEYATPIMTLHDMSNDPKAGFSREEKDIQISLFVCKLREILDADDKCKGKYKIITFAGGNQDIAEIMIRALNDCALEM